MILRLVREGREGEGAGVILEPFLAKIRNSTEAEPRLVHASHAIELGAIDLDDLSLQQVGVALCQLDDLLGSDVGDVTVDDEAPEGGEEGVKERSEVLRWLTHRAQHTRIASWLR
jgi:hypothetical protein